MAREYKLNAILDHTLASLDDFSGTGGVREVVQTYVASQAEGSFARLNWLEDPSSAVPFSARSDVWIVVTSRADASAKMNQIDGNLGSLPGTTVVHYRYIEKDV